MDEDDDYRPYPSWVRDVERPAYVARSELPTPSLCPAPRASHALPAHSTLSFAASFHHLVIAKGTPNLSKEVRAIPHPGTFWAPWYRGGELKRELPYDVSVSRPAL